VPRQVLFRVQRSVVCGTPDWFTPDSHVPPVCSVTDNMRTASGALERALDPVHMVWVIQRDFLQGKSTQAAVDEALVTVPNPNNEAGIEQVRCIPLTSLPFMYATSLR
jgi:hypothetical protein